MKKLGKDLGRAHGLAGSTMVVIAVLMAAVAMLSLSVLMTLRSSHSENQGSRESLSALYACEAGLTEAVNDLSRGGTGTINNGQPVAFGEQRYWVQANDMGDGRVTLTSYGKDDRAQMGVEMVVRPSEQGFFKWAAFGDESLHMDSNSRTDSYDSGDGDYASQQVNGSGSGAYANSDGDIGSNGNIDVDTNEKVWGDACPGPSGTVTGDLTKISGSTTPMASTVTFPPIVVPAIALTGDLVVSASQTLASGEHHFGNLTLNSNKVLTVTGPATIVCSNLVMNQNSQLIVNADDGPVTFYVIDDFVLKSNIRIHSNDDQPSDVAFNLLSDNIIDPGIDVEIADDLVDFDSGSKMIGTIYAPSAEVTVDSNFELFGSLVARRVDLNSNCRIHYDEQLATYNPTGEVVYESLCWRIVARP